jgi:hypothetical protein
MTGRACFFFMVRKAAGSLSHRNDFSRRHQKRQHTAAVLAPFQRRSIWHSRARRCRTGSMTKAIPLHPIDARARAVNARAN